MSEWYTVASAANWLADHLGLRHYSADMLWHAIQQGALQAHYWPIEPVSLGLFNLANSNSSVHSPKHCKEVGLEKARTLIATIMGPIPFDDYAAFSVSTVLSKDPAFEDLYQHIGITARSQIEHTPLGICLGVDEMGHPFPLNEIDFAVLVHTDNLLAYHRNLPGSRKLRPAMEISKYGDDGRELPTWVARCAQTGGSIPFAEESQHPADDEDSEPMLRALALAAHVIADLAERLDQKEPTLGLHLNLRVDGRPNTRGIAMKLSAAAKALNYSGYGAGHRGFEERLRKALKTI